MLLNISISNLFTIKCLSSQCRLKLQTKPFQIHRIMIRHLAFKIVTQQTQQFQCTSNSWLKGSETKKIKRKQRKKHNSHHVLATEIKGLRTRENKLQKHLKKTPKNYNIIPTPLSPTLTLI